MNIDKDIAHIVYATDDKFAEVLGVSLVSLYHNSRDMKDIIIYILDSGISDENKKKIVSVSRQYDRTEPVFIPATDICGKLGMNVSVDRGSLSQYARLFVSSDLPSDLSRVIYLDCDILIEKSIRRLWNLDLQGKTIAALMDAFSKQYRKNIGLEKNDIMFNSGVMVIDLECWKDKNVESRLLEFIVQKKGRIQQGDQGALNHVLSHETFCFEPRFNAVTIFFDFTYKEMLTYRNPPVFYPEALVAEAVDDPDIVHFTTSIFSKRPWIEGCHHKYVDHWITYKAQSPWKDQPLWKDNRSGIKKFVSKSFNLLPKKMAVHIAGILQVHIRPFVNSL